MKDAVFYSNYCSYCKQLMELLEKKNLKMAFIPICIDNPSLKLPSSITEVPTLLQRGKLYIGEKAFEYILSTHNGSNIDSWQSNEMGGFSTKYAYIDDNLNNNQMQNFDTINISSSSIITPPALSMGKGNKGKGQKSGKDGIKYEDLLSERSKQLSQLYKK